MYRMSVLTVLVMALLLVSGAAWAHCGHCGVGESDTHAGMDSHEGHDHAGPDHGDMQKDATVLGSCPGCGMDGGLCAHCVPMAAGMLKQMAVEFCPNCNSADALCEMCTAGVDGALHRMQDGIIPEVVEVPGHEVAYVEGTLMGDIEGLFGELIGAAIEQGLMTEETMVVGICPDGMSVGFGPETTYYAAVSLPEDADVVAPLQVFEIPSGEYLMVNHYGSHEELGASWMAAFAWAEMAGVELGTGPCGEHYVSDPETTPAEELLTEIYIPLAAAADVGAA